MGVSSGRNPSPRKNDKQTTPLAKEFMLLHSAFISYNGKGNFQNVNSKWKNTFATFKKNLYISIMHEEEKKQKCYKIGNNLTPLHNTIVRTKKDGML